MLSLAEFSAGSRALWADTGPSRRSYKLGQAGRHWAKQAVVVAVVAANDVVRVVVVAIVFVVVATAVVDGFVNQAVCLAGIHNPMALSRYLHHFIRDGSALLCMAQK